MIELTNTRPSSEKQITEKTRHTILAQYLHTPKLSMEFQSGDSIRQCTYLKFAKKGTIAMSSCLHISEYCVLKRGNVKIIYFYLHISCFRIFTLHSIFKVFFTICRRIFELLQHTPAKLKMKLTNVFSVIIRVFSQCLNFRVTLLLKRASKSEA